MDVKDAIVVVDVLTNDVRGTRQRPAASPEDLVWRVHRLRERLWEAGAAAVVICQLKPMEIADVTLYNSLLDDYLRAQGGTGFGCRTQVLRSHLKPDGYHVRGQFDSVIDMTYACAILGRPVPRPTPLEDFAPEMARRRYRAEWPSLVRNGAGGRGVGYEGPMNHYGW